MDTGEVDVKRLLLLKYPGLTAELNPSGYCNIRGVICSEVSKSTLNIPANVMIVL